MEMVFKIVHFLIIIGFGASSKHVKKNKNKIVETSIIFD